MLNLTNLVLACFLYIPQPSDSLPTKLNNDYEFVQEPLKIPLGHTNFKEGDTLRGAYHLTDSTGADTAYVLFMGIIKKDSSCVDSLYIEIYDNISDAEKLFIEKITRSKRNPNKPIYFDPRLIK